MESQALIKGQAVWETKFLSSKQQHPQPVNPMLT